MKFLKNLFNKKNNSMNSYEDFWDWFVQHEEQFYKVILEQDNLEENFFKKLGEQLDALREGYYFLAGMMANKQAELVLTADGIIKNIVFVEELIAAAPDLPNWKFTALKQPVNIKKASIKMNEFKFDAKTMQFYAVEHEQMPDEIDLVFTHKDWSEDNKNVITNGVFLAIDTYLGELKSVTTIDNIKIIHPEEAKQPLIPLSKLKSFLVWREKEFVEKYQDVRYTPKDDSYYSVEATLPNGWPLFATINANLLEWENKASHPWLVLLQIHYEGQHNSGLPPEPAFDLLNEIEDNIMEYLQAQDGYLNVGRQTANCVREVYWYCIDFRKPSKVLDYVKNEYQDQVKITFEIYKDKYWQYLHRFQPH